MNNKPKQTNSTFISIGLAAETTGYPEDHLRELAQAGDFTATKIGEKWFIDRVELRQYVSENKKGSVEITTPIKENRLASRWRLTKDGHRPMKKEVIERSSIPRALTVAFTAAAMVLLVAGLLPAGGFDKLAITPDNTQSQEDPLQISHETSLLTASVIDARYAVQVAAASMLETSEGVVRPLKNLAASSLSSGVDALTRFGDLIISDVPPYTVPQVFAYPKNTRK